MAKLNKREREELTEFVKCCYLKEFGVARIREAVTIVFGVEFTRRGIEYYINKAFYDNWLLELSEQNKIVENWNNIEVRNKPTSEELLAEAIFESVCQCNNDKYKILVSHNETIKQIIQ